LGEIAKGIAEVFECFFEHCVEAFDQRNGEHFNSASELVY